MEAASAGLPSEALTHAQANQHKQAQEQVNDKWEER